MEAVKNQNIADIDKYTEELNKLMGELYQNMAGQQGGPQAGPQGPQYGPQGPNNNPDAPDEQ